VDNKGYPGSIFIDPGFFFATNDGIASPPSSICTLIDANGGAVHSRKSIVFIFSCSLWFTCEAALADKVEREVTQPVNQAISLQQSTQKQEEQWRAEREKLQHHLDELTGINEELNDRKQEAEEAVSASRTRIEAKRRQLADVSTLVSEIPPITDDLLSSLVAVVDEDLPFLPDERQKRIAALEPALSDPNISYSEKYRKVMEALLVEVGYGFSCDVYQQDVDIEGDQVLVDIFRLGRLGLFYLSLDGRQCGFYNVAAHTWQPLPVRHLPEIRKAVAIGLRRQPADLLDLPVGRMVKQ
jgi:hypothetical protein